MLSILASPHADGVTDTLAQAWACGARSAGAEVEEIRLREYEILPCDGCGFCARDGLCKHRDDGSMLLNKLAQAHIAFIAAPIYFYALPGPFKTFIDRAQAYWYAGERSQTRQTAVLLAGGRQEGEKLFDGSLLTLSWFLKTLGHSLSWRLLCRGLENLDDLKGRAQYKTQAYVLGADMARVGP